MDLYLQVRSCVPALGGWVLGMCVQSLFSYWWHASMYVSPPLSSCWWQDPLMLQSTKSETDVFETKRKLGLVSGCVGGWVAHEWVHG